MIRHITWLALLMPLLLQAADWQLDAENSHVNFTTIKNGEFAETHFFRGMSGSVTKSGRVEVAVDLGSVDTLIQIRDQRMRELLFETGRFPEATFRAKADVRKLLKEMEQGASRTLSVPGRLALHGVSQRLTLAVQLSRLDENRVKLVSVQPTLLRAGDFQLLDGLEKLRNLAGLTSISPAVSVYFSVQFVRQN